MRLIVASGADVIAGPWDAGCPPQGNFVNTNASRSSASDCSQVAHCDQPSRQRGLLGGSPHQLKAFSPIRVLRANPRPPSRVGRLPRRPRSACRYRRPCHRRCVADRVENRHIATTFAHSHPNSQTAHPSSAQRRDEFRAVRVRVQRATACFVIFLLGSTSSVERSGGRQTRRVLAVVHATSVHERVS